MRTSSNNVNPFLKKEIVNTLAQAMADLNNQNKVLSFLNSFFKKSELETFAKRLAIAYWLKKGRSYSNIKQNLKVSSATIATIQESMKQEGFQLALEKIEAEEWASQWVKKIKKIFGQ